MSVSPSNNPEPFQEEEELGETLEFQMPSFSVLSRELMLADIPGETKERFLDCYFPTHEGYYHLMLEMIPFYL